MTLDFFLQRKKALVSGLVDGEGMFGEERTGKCLFFVLGGSR